MRKGEIKNPQRANYHAQLTNFVAANENAKSSAVTQLIRIARKNRFDHDDFLCVCQQARRKLGLRETKRERKLPQLLSEGDLKHFFQVIQKCGDLQHEIMLKLLFFTAVQVRGLAHIEVSDIDLDECKIFIDQRKETKTTPIPKTATCLRRGGSDRLPQGESSRLSRTTPNKPAFTSASIRTCFTIKCSRF
jgi:integrase